MEADITRLARSYVSHPLLELYVEIKRLRNGVFELLRGRQHPRQTTDLYVAASRLCGLSAHVCLDLGDYDSAATHARTSRACAEAAGHEGMLAWVRAVESLIAYWTGRYEQAARLAQAGRRHRAGGSIGARLASLEARAPAIVGDRVGVVAALADAERSREAMVGLDEVPGIFAFPAAKQFTYAGTSYLAVGGREQVQQAIVSAEPRSGSTAAPRTTTSRWATCSPPMSISPVAICFWVIWTAQRRCSPSSSTPPRSACRPVSCAGSSL